MAGRHGQTRAPTYVSGLDAPLRPSAVVVARDPLVRSGLVAVLSAYPGLVLKEASSSTTSADVVVWDAPDRQQHEAGAAVLALVDTAAEALAALRAGALGALSRSSPSHAIAPAALAVAAGHHVLDSSFLGALLSLEPPPAVLPAGPTLLSPREHQVLELVAEGLSNREVAARLGISRHTAKFHLNAILEKLGATTRTEAVVLAARSGVLTL